MKILLVHNFYQRAGGEDQVVAAEQHLLRAHGHTVITYFKDNRTLESTGSWLMKTRALLVASIKTIWNPETYRDFRALLRRENPDVVHSHNTFPLISPSLYWACAAEHVPIIQTLHNYRLLCLNAFLFRNCVQAQPEACAKQKPRAYNPSSLRNQGFRSAIKDANEHTSVLPEGIVCERCLGKRFKWPGVYYACYRNSKAGSLVVALMLLAHKWAATWTQKVTLYVALTEFQKQKLCAEGLSEQKILVKPNFTAPPPREDVHRCPEPHPEHPSSGSLPKEYKRGALFVGRLSQEKGCALTIRAWEILGHSKVNKVGPNSYQDHPELLIIGDGPERTSLEMLAARVQKSTPFGKIRLLGQRPRSEIFDSMKQAQFIILPSLWYEGFPMTIVEAFSCGLPVLASNIGSMPSLIESGQTGLLFEAGNIQDLAAKMDWMLAHPEERAAMGRAARQAYEAHFTPEANYAMLMDIYRQAMTTP